MDDPHSEDRAGAGAEPERTNEGRFPDGGSHAMLAASADGIVAVDEQGIIRLCNPAAEKLFARSPGELVGRPFGSPLVVDKTSDIDLIRPDGSTQVVEMRVTATTWEGQRLYVAALRDVTHHKQAERDIETQLEHQHVVVGVAAHELRNPVVAIKMLLHQLRAHRLALTDEEKSRIIDELIDRTDQLQALLHKLLTASTIDAEATHARAEPILVLEFLLAELAEFADRANDVRLSCNPDLVAFVDPGEFAEMLTNYLENAFVYGHPPVDVEATRRADWVEIRVCDRGAGVPDAFTPQLFQRFSREPHARQRTTEGTGLGLWIVRGLSQANGGDAWYEPHSGGGACFCLRLPGAPTP
jgi:signal transduction histidine kinase